MKIIGLMCTWNNLEFFKCAFKQAWEFCDELIIVEGCHSRQYLKQSTDGTIAFINSINTRPRLRIMDFNQNNRYDYVQRTIRHMYPMKSRYYQPGNWVFHWDDDLLFMEKDLQKIKYAMRHSKEGSLDFQCRHFIYNFRFNSLRCSGVYCYRITEGLRLSGVSNAHYKDGRRYSVRKLDDITAFHYGCIKWPERMRARWEMSVEKGTERSVGRHEKWMGVSWNENEDIFKSESLIKEFTGSGTLNIYEGKHPEAVADHPWKDIDDVRTMK